MKRMTDFFSRKRKEPESDDLDLSNTSCSTISCQPGPVEHSTEVTEPNIDTMGLNERTIDHVNAILDAPRNETLYNPDDTHCITQTSLAVQLDDIGGLLQDAIRKLTDIEKYDLINNYFVPEPSYVFPKIKLAGCNRSFRAEWLTKYRPWLVYSKVQNGGYCLPCTLFCNKDNVGILVNRPFTLWHKVTRFCGQHGTMTYHRDSMAKYENFIKTTKDPRCVIDCQMDKKRKERVENNRRIIASVVDCVLFCGKIGIALRGHRDDATCTDVANKGNFAELVRFRAMSGDSALAEHFENSKRNATYLSKTVQNELISIIGDYIRSKILAEIKNAKFFSILADEVTDLSNLEQLSIVLRFVDQCSNIREEFLGFETADRITGEALANIILTKIREWGLDIKDCRGQGYDGAANMSSKLRGVNGIISNMSPKAIYAHCNSHILNLVIVSACSLPVIRNMANTITEVAYFFRNSPKRQRFFELVIQANPDTDKRTKLLDLCRTRWIRRHDAYEVFYEKLPTVLDTLDAIIHGNVQFGDQWNWDRETLTKANGLFHSMCTFQFLISLVCTLHVMSIIRPISVKLQERCADVISAYTMVQTTRAELSSLRENGEQKFKSYYDDACSLGSNFDFVAKTPRTTTLQRHRNNHPASNPEEYYRRSVFMPFLDHVNEEMNARFGPLQEKATSLMCLVPNLTVANLPPIQDIAAIYVSDLPHPVTLETEYDRWKLKWSSVNEKPNTLLKTLESCDATLYPNINTLLRIACTMPVTSCENERSNSSLKLLKTYLRTTMATERLSGLALMKIHQHMVIDIETVVDTFARLNQRRMLLLDPLVDKQ